MIRLMMRREGISEEAANKSADLFERIDGISGRPSNWYRSMLETYNEDSQPEPEPCDCGCECCG